MSYAPVNNILVLRGKIDAINAVLLILCRINNKRRINYDTRR